MMSGVCGVSGGVWGVSGGCLGVSGECLGASGGVWGVLGGFWGGGVLDTFTLKMIFDKNDKVLECLIPSLLREVMT